MVKRKRAKKTVGPRASSSRQRLRLIDACISALHIYGPSRTTVEKVVAIAGMSPGIVRFYFKSKASMLVASLQYLATEFEQRVLIPVANLRDEPVRALTTLVELYLDPEIASPRKVSVWYSFWGEASSREEYLDICGQKDARFAELVRELIDRVIAESDNPTLDADAVALGLIGVLEMLWQDIAFQTEVRLDGGAARRRGLAYLRSVFPGQFPDLSGAPRRKTPAVRVPWQIAAHECEIASPGDFITAELAGGAVLLLRDQAGNIRAVRNVCPTQPHALVVAPRGRLHGAPECPIHGPATAPLVELDTAIRDGLVLVSAPRHGDDPRPPPLAWNRTLDGVTAELAPMPPLSVAAAPAVFSVGAPWQRLVEQWLAFDLPETPVGRLAGLLQHAQRTVDAATGQVHWVARVGAAAPSWSARRYAALAAGSAKNAPPPAHWYRLFVPPNQILERRPEGLSVLQAIAAAGGCSLRWLEYRAAGADRRLMAMSYLARRLRAVWITQDIEAAQSLRRADH
jgi:AcrR family transcriptional regulator/phenylpropionate dioxygenase-like ring-hydroxylating dioxygenase large terminal subunit